MDLFSKLKELKILLIDDDKWIRDSMRLFFEFEGCNFLALETAEEAMEELKMHNYDIIIVDYKLPGMDGLALIKRIQDSHLGAMKILITAYRSGEVISEAINMGVKEIIEKPFTSKIIETSLSRLIEAC